VPRTCRSRLKGRGASTVTSMMRKGVNACHHSQHPSCRRIHVVDRALRQAPCTSSHLVASNIRILSCTRACFKCLVSQYAPCCSRSPGLFRSCWQHLLQTMWRAHDGVTWQHRNPHDRWHLQQHGWWCGILVCENSLIFGCTVCLMCTVAVTAAVQAGLSSTCTQDAQRLQLFLSG
jgi:hypothetical protein